MVWCPFPDREAAREAAEILLQEKLIACANIVGDIESLFEWQGAVQTSHECGLIFKTSGDCLAALVDRLGALHPYETPAILGWHCDEAHRATLTWLQEVVPGK